MTCTSQKAFTGITSCRTKPAKPFGFWLLDKTTSKAGGFELNNDGTLNADLIALIQSGKLIPIYGLVNFADGSTAETFQDNNYGHRQKTDGGKWIWTYSVDLNSVCNEMSLDALDSGLYEVVFIDEAQQLFGIFEKKSGSETTYVINGFPAKVSVGNPMPATQSTSQFINISIEVLNPLKTAAKGGIIDFEDIDIVETFEGLNKISIGSAAAPSATSIVLTDVFGCGFQVPTFLTAASIDVLDDQGDVATVSAVDVTTAGVVTITVASIGTFGDVTINEYPYASDTIRATVA